MEANSPLRALLQSALRLDRPQVSPTTALRNALGITVPLGLGLAMGQVLAGLTLAIGALNVAFSDRPDPYPFRARRMLLASLAGALSAVVGSSTASIGWLAMVLAMAWGFGGGLLVALGPDWGQVGLVSVILLVVFSGQPLTPDQAAITGALIFVGGVFQTLLAVAAWPFRPYGPERQALAAVFGALAAYTRAPSEANVAPPLTAEATAAQIIVSGVANGPSGGGWRALLDEAERIRLVLIALNDTRQRLCREQPEAGTATARLVDQSWSIAGELLAGIAETITSGQTSVSAPRQAQGLDVAVQAARQGVADPLEEEALILVETLLAQLRTAVETSEQLQLAGDRVLDDGAPRLAPPFDLRNPVATLRANLTLGSASFRHAVRLAVSLGLAVVLARGLGLPHGYWVPLTVAIVLKPDFSTTFVRGALRVGGTLLGLVVATVLILLVSGNLPVEVVLVGVLIYAIRRLVSQNYGLAAICITSLVVILLTLAGASPEATIVDRGLATLVGGALALVVYAIWPTWERTQKPEILADLLDAYRRYFNAVIVGYLDPGRLDTKRLNALRLEARLARTNAEASIERLRGEPARSEAELDRAVAFVAASNRFVRAAIALEADLYARRASPAGPPLLAFAGEVDLTLRSLARALQEPGQPMPTLPNLRAGVQALAGGIPSEPIRSHVVQERRLRLAAFVAETERIVDSLNAMAQLVRRRGRPAGEDRGPTVDERAA